jgi:hypothetical protein
MFQFLDPGPLIDGDLTLALNEEFPGDPPLNYGSATASRSNDHAPA